MNGLWLMVAGLVVLDVLVAAWVLQEWRGYQARKWLERYGPIDWDALGETLRALRWAFAAMTVSADEMAAAFGAFGAALREGEL